MNQSIISLKDLCFKKLKIYFLTHSERKINLLLNLNKVKLENFKFKYNTLYWYPPFMKNKKYILFPTIKIDNKFISKNKKSFIESDIFLQSLFQNILKISYNEAKKIIEYKGVKDLVLWNIYRNYSFYKYSFNSDQIYLQKINKKTCYPHRKNNNNVKDCIFEIYEYIQNKKII
jgi:hypothetical protein